MLDMKRADRRACMLDLKWDPLGLKKAEMKEILLEFPRAPM